MGAPTREAQRRKPASDAYLSAHPFALATKSWESLGLLEQSSRRATNAVPKMSALLLTSDAPPSASSTFPNDAPPGAVTVASGSTTAGRNPNWVPSSLRDAAGVRYPHCWATSSSNLPPNVGGAANELTPHTRDLSSGWAGINA